MKYLTSKLSTCLLMPNKLYFDLPCSIYLSLLLILFKVSVIQCKCRITNLKTTVLIRSYTCFKIWLSLQFNPCNLSQSQNLFSVKSEKSNFWSTAHTRHTVILNCTCYIMYQINCKVKLDKIHLAQIIRYSHTIKNM